MTVDTSQEQGSIGHGQADRPSGGGGLRWQVVAWLALSLGLLVWLLVGSVSTTSYSYNSFLQMTYRTENDTPLQDIWSYQAEHLPDVQLQWALDWTFVGSLVVIVACMIAGSWLLLVRSSDPTTRRRRSRQYVPRRTA